MCTQKTKIKVALHANSFAYIMYLKKLEIVNDGVLVRTNSRILSD